MSQKKDLMRNRFLQPCWSEDLELTRTNVQHTLFTRIQNMKIIDGKPKSRGALDVLVKVTSKEEVFSLWNGFTPYFARLGPDTVLTFIYQEQMNKFYKKIVLGDSASSGGGSL